ncbi:hypothetical protein KKG31_09035 [Patescibacteria group bacterium]|nr:hypothetical protein [Patescibacteria group bacterium]MBU1759196.1 hypothetical protein [Patescibacteria group bacterium]MBU1906618.1 hypothetical protein [Patescibacteria group bacterium]
MAKGHKRRPRRRSAAEVKLKHYREQHARRRALQRYDVYLDHHAYLELCQKINGGVTDPSKVVLLHQQSNTRTAYAIYHQDIWLGAIYHKGTNQIVTFIPPENLEALIDELIATT